MKLLFTFLITLAAAAPCMAETQTPIKTCFGDYVQSFLKDEAETVRAAIRARCLSPDFNKRWKKEVKAQGADPFLLAQDTPSSWTEIEVKTEKSGTRVVLGSGDEQHCLMVKTSGPKQLIESVKACPKN